MIAHHCRQPIELIAGKKAKDERLLDRRGRAACGLDRRFDLPKHDARMVQEHAAGVGELDAFGATDHEVAAEFKLPGRASVG